MSSMYLSKLKLSIFGQSHSAGIGVVIDGLPSGEDINLDALQTFLNRRASGGKPWTTARTEADRPEILSGLVDGKTCGAPLAAVIRNLNTRSGDYDNLRDVPRPGHADYTAHVKYGGFQDVSGGGHFSGRLTAPLCVAGGIAMQILERRGVQVGAHLFQVGSVRDSAFDGVELNAQMLKSAAQKSFPVLNDNAGEQMQAQIRSAKEALDSLGGIVECAAIGVPAGLGEPMFDGMENRIARIVFAIPAVKGLEFGAGFGVASMRGSENNDPFYMDNGTVKTQTNNAGGILGGISNGMPLIFRAAIKPTPSISRPQQSVSLSRGEAAELVIQGRHDPCIAPRAVPVMEAALALAILDSILEDR